jgi:hypothetical protein
MLNFVLPSFFHPEKSPFGKGQLLNASGCIVGTAELIAFREPRGRYQRGGSKVIGAGFVFAVETFDF